MLPTPPPDTVAAVDLGTNSFHMVVAKIVHGQLEIVDRIREQVSLGAGFDVKKRLTPEVQERALACLGRFGQRLRELPQGSVRAVGTNALRQARNAREFLEKARSALGHAIEVVPGPEEARLIYLGVSHSSPDVAGHRLVIDIGGGSTECILGERFDPLLTASLFMGSVSWSLRHFPGGEVTRDGFYRAQVAALLEFQSIERRFRGVGWEACVGSSGTILAVDEILRANEWSEGAITLKGIKRLRKEMLEAGHCGRFAFAGLEEDRRGILSGGAAILTAAFESLQIERMEPSPGALREGLLYDLVGRIQHEDVRDRTIQRLVQRYGLDVEQGARVWRSSLYA
ncbi:MAG: exopolyphosphatase, partial [Planctomycetota bacterium]